MINKENKSKYWLRKWQTQRWEDFETLEIGSIFDTSVANHVQMADSIGDRILWYRSDKDKGIYFATEVVAEPKQDDAYQNAWSMSLRVVKALISNPVKLEKSDFNNLMRDIDAKGQGGGTSNILKKYEPEKLWELVLGNEKAIWKEQGNVAINEKDLFEIKNIKDKNINDGKMFNPFLDMNLVRNEVRHLNFLTNLLNPHGSHHQGDSFLKIFIDEILAYENQAKNQQLINFLKSENIYVKTEKSTPNGRIDIWIESDDFVIAIEGKTETVDSKGQLTKYDEFLQNEGKPYLLIYLTLYGEAPTDIHPDNLQLMDFNNDIMSFISNSLEIKALPKKILTTLNEYRDSMLTYLNNFSDTWTYELDIIDEITKDTESYLQYENIKNNYFYNTAQYKYSVVEDIANIFEKAKARIERNFMEELSEYLANDLKKEGFTFSTDSEILVNDFEDNVKVDINYDINTIFETRKNRTASFEKDDIDSIREKSGIKIIYVNARLENEFLLMTILNDIYGVNVYFNHVKEDECINYFEGQHIELLSSDIFHSSNISKLLDEKYSSKLIQECKTKIMNGFKEINI